MNVELSVEQAVKIDAGGITLHGDLSVPERAQGLVLFAHGSGSSRHSRRNRAVAAALVSQRLATLLMDLLTEEEEAIDVRTATYRFDIDLLAGRVAAAVDWVGKSGATRTLRTGLFGASTGAAAALIAAAARPDRVHAVVSRGGRPDLAGAALRHVQAPTLLIVGGEDQPVIELNRQAYASLACERHIEIVPGATHLFEEPGALEEVARLAGAWFTHHLGAGAPAKTPLT